MVAKECTCLCWFATSLIDCSSAGRQLWGALCYDPCPDDYTMVLGTYDVIVVLCLAAAGQDVAHVCTPLAAASISLITPHRRCCSGNRNVLAEVPKRLR